MRDGILEEAKDAAKKILEDANITGEEKVEEAKKALNKMVNDAKSVKEVKEAEAKITEFVKLAKEAVEAGQELEELLGA